MDKRWIAYLSAERQYKLHRIAAFDTGFARLHMTTEGVQLDITDETVAKLREDVAEIEQILSEEGITWHA